MRSWGAPRGIGALVRRESHPATECRWPSTPRKRALTRHGACPPGPQISSLQGPAGLGSVATQPERTMQGGIHVSPSRFREERHTVPGLPHQLPEPHLSVALAPGPGRACALREGTDADGMPRGDSPGETGSFGISPKRENKYSKNGIRGDRRGILGKPPEV